MMQKSKKLLCGYRMMDGKWQVVRYLEPEEEKNTPLQQWIQKMEHALLFPASRLEVLDSESE